MPQKLWKMKSDDLRNNYLTLLFSGSGFLRSTAKSPVGL
jgi:hypothetical protein